MAKDRLKKNESDGVTTIPILYPPTTQRVNCGALPVGPGTGLPSAACPGLP